MDFKLPELGEGVYEAELVSWKVKPGDIVKPGQVLLEVLTDKATMEVPAPFGGTIGKLNGEPGQPLKVGDVILSYDGKAAAAQNDGAETKLAPASKPAIAMARREVNGPAAGTAESVKAAPSVRLMARKLGIDLGGIHGSGPDGRILIADLTHHVQPFSGEPKATEELRPDFGHPGTRIKLIGVRRKIAEHMSHAKQVVPHYGYVDECEITDIVRLREGLKEAGQERGIKITYLSFFIRAVVDALKEVPIVNASLDEQAGEIVLHDRYHIGFAAATPAGLIVPVVHDADKKGILDLAREVEQLSTEARNGKIKRDSLQGGTFTITSIGSIGGLISTPIINHPEVGILGVGKIVKRPVYDASGQLRPADMVYLSFSFDHRVLDGAVGAAFGNAVIKRLKNPAGLLIL